jgi:hypothetical protein
MTLISMVPVGNMLEMRYLHMATSVFFTTIWLLCRVFSPK